VNTLLVALATVGLPGAVAAQILETETTRLVPAGVLEVGSNFEYQRSGDGSETALPFAFTYGVTNRLELMVEPVVYTTIHPKTGPRATGVGDLEATLTYRLRTESRSVPSFAIASEVKFPTARNTLIGTGKTDFTSYLIASKRFERLDLHANIGYTLVGQPAGIALDNTLNGALGAIWRLSSWTELFGELLANTSSAPGGQAENSTTPEAAGGEVVGTVGIARQIGSNFHLAFGISYDNNGAVLLRPGFVWRAR